MDTGPLDPDLFAILVCPLSQQPLKLCGDRLVSTCPDTRRSYRIADGVPIMLVDEATELDEAAWQAAMAETGPISGTTGSTDE